MRILRRPSLRERGGEEDIASIVVEESYVANGSVALLNDSEEAPLEDSDDALDDSDDDAEEESPTEEDEVTSLLLSLEVEVEVGAIKGALEVVISGVDSLLLLDEAGLELVTISEELNGETEDDEASEELSWLLSRVEDDEELDEEGIVDDSRSVDDDDDNNEEGDSLNGTADRLLEAVLEAVLGVSSLLDEVVCDTASPTPLLDSNTSDELWLVLALELELELELELGDGLEDLTLLDEGVIEGTSSAALEETLLDLSVEELAGVLDEGVLRKLVLDGVTVDELDDASSCLLDGELEMLDQEEDELQLDEEEEGGAEDASCEEVDGLVEEDEA